MRVSQAVLLTCVIRTKGGQRSSGEPAKQISLRQKEAFLHAAPGRGVGRPPPGKEDTRPPWKHADAGRGKHARFHLTRALLCLQKHFNTKRTPLAFTLFCTLWSPPPCSRPPQSRFHFKCKASGSHKEAAKETITIFALLVYFWRHWVFLAAGVFPPAAGSGVIALCGARASHGGSFSR